MMDDLILDGAVSWLKNNRMELYFSDTSPFALSVKFKGRKRKIPLWVKEYVRYITKDRWIGSSIIDETGIKVDLKSI